MDMYFNSKPSYIAATGQYCLVMTDKDLASLKAILIAGKHGEVAEDLDRNWATDVLQFMQNEGWVR